MGDGPSGKTFLAVSSFIFIVILVGVVFASRKLGEPMGLITAVSASVSALVVALFVTLLLLGPKKQEPEIDGFEVDQIKR